MEFVSEFLHHFKASWESYYPILMFVSILLALALAKVAKGMPRFTLLMLTVFVLCFLTKTVFLALKSDSNALIMHRAGVLILGMLLIRQTFLLIFRRIVPRLGFAPPRILEELLILLAYLGWVLMRLSQAGLDPSSLLASTAVVTAVIAFAMQDTLGNILAGLALQLDHSVRIGDWIELPEFSGKVIQVQWRHTAIITLFGEKILIPNSYLMKTHVKVIGGGAVPKRRRTVLFYAEFNIMPSDVISLIESTLADAKLEDIDSHEPPVCMVTDFANGLVTYAVRYWLLDPSAPGAADSIVRQHIHAVFQRNGWQMAAPGMDLSLVSRRAKQTEYSQIIQHSIENKVDLLKSVDLLKPLTHEELVSMAGKLKTVHYVKGSLIARQNEVGNSMFIIKKGVAGIWLEQHGYQQKVAEVGVSEVIGEMSLMTGDPRRATITALSDMVCYELSKTEFEDTLKQRPELMDMFANLLTMRNQSLTKQRDNMQNVQTYNYDERKLILQRIRNWFGA